MLIFKDFIKVDISCRRAPCCFFLELFFPPKGTKCSVEAIFWFWRIFWINLHIFTSSHISMNEGTQVFKEELWKRFCWFIWLLCGVSVVFL